MGYAFVGDATVTGALPVTTEPAGRLIWRGTVFEVPVGASVIGRDRACAIQIDADSVSRRHARLGVNPQAMIRGSCLCGEVRFEISGDQRPTKTAVP